MTNQKQLSRILNAWERVAKSNPELQSRFDMLSWVDGSTAEPGYDDIATRAFGDWNSIDSIDPRDPMFRIGRMLESIDVELHWHDEWSQCSECSKPFRVQPDCYGWQPSYFVLNDCESICHHCIDSNIDEVLETCAGSHRISAPPTIDLTEHGYKLVHDGFERGLHHHQNAEPQAIADLLEKIDVRKYIFQVDAIGQFDVQFSVYVPEADYDAVCDLQFT